MKPVLLLGLLLLISPTQSTRKQVKETAKADITLRKVSDMVHIIRPEKGPKYSSTVARAMVSASKEYKIPLDLLATTGYIESEFSMLSGPCVGIMQVYLPTYKEMDRKTGLNPYKLKDNIRLGARELSRYYHHPLASRHGGSWRLKYTWGRYNGAGPSSGYVKRAMKVHSKVKNMSVKDMQVMLRKKHVLWR